MPPQKFNYKLKCAKCGTIYLRIPKSVTYKTMIRCSICSTPLGTWKELEDDFISQGGWDGIFEMDDGQITRRG